MFLCECVRSTLLWIMLCTRVLSRRLSLSLSPLPCFPLSSLEPLPSRSTLPDDGRCSDTQSRRRTGDRAPRHSVSLSSALVSLSRTQSSRHSRIDHEQSCALRSVASDTAVLAGIPLAPLPLPPPPPLACREHQPDTAQQHRRNMRARPLAAVSRVSDSLNFMHVWHNVFAQWQSAHTSRRAAALRSLSGRPTGASCGHHPLVAAERRGGLALPLAEPAARGHCCPRRHSSKGASARLSLLGP